MCTWLILHTLSALALAVLALVLGRWLRLGPAARHALWLVVLVKLLTPPVVAWPWSLSIPLPGLAATDTTRPAPQPSPDPSGGEASAPATFEFVLAPAEESRDDAPGQQPETASVGEGASLAAAGAWLLGGAFLAGRHMLRAYRIRRLLQYAYAAPPALASAIKDLADDMGMSPPRVAVLPGLGSPVVWALGPARLLWPAGLEDGLSPEAMRAVLTHELAHLRRRDHWVGWLVLAAGCLWWWHPLFWLVRRRLHREAELACDAWVVARLPAARRAYAEALLLVCQRWSLPAAAAPALGAAGQRRDLERRLIMVLREEVPYRLSLRWLLGIGALAVLGIPALTSGQQPGETAKPAVKAVTFTDEPTADRDHRIKELEDRVQALLKEIQALRGGQPKRAQTTEKHAPKTATGVYEYTLQQKPYSVEVHTVPGYTSSVVVGDKRDQSPEAGPVNEVALIRATYKLKQAQAEALGKFLSENVKASVMETKVDGDNVIITTTPDAQRVVTQMIALMQGKMPQGHAFYYQWSRPKDQAK